MSAVKYLKSITPLVRASSGVGIQTENACFRLHNKFTVGLLIGSSVLLSATEFFGKPINCLSSLPKKVINTYCWITSTFTMDDYSLREMGTQVAAPGIRTPDSFDDEHIQQKWRFHNYYQWVVFFLCFQAFLCYLPKYIWKVCEGGLMKSLSQNLSKIIYKDNEISSRKDLVIDYIMAHLKMHNSYVFKYWSCELLCFVNIIAQLFMINSFLGGAFFSYGFKEMRKLFFLNAVFIAPQIWAVLSCQEPLHFALASADRVLIETTRFLPVNHLENGLQIINGVQTMVLEFSEQDQEERVDPMIYVFPRMTKCHFHLFGVSGTVQRRDAFCLLAQNILNEKIFIFIWFWFIILAILLGFLIMYRLCLIFLPELRLRIIYRHTQMVPMETLQVIAKKSSIGDWWIFYLLASTIEAQIYRDILMRLAKEIETDASERPAAYSKSGKSNGAGCSSTSTANGGGASPCGSAPNRVYPNVGNSRSPYLNSLPASAPPSTAYAQSAV